MILFVSVVIGLGYLGIRQWNGKWFTQYERPQNIGFLHPLISFILQLLWMILFSIVIVIVVAILSTLRALLGKWRTINVFISYEHRHKDIVSILRSSLDSRWINPVFVPFEPTDHDILIEKVQRSIKSADLVLVLPGSQKSFVDAEVLTASALEKPIIYIKVTDTQRTPDTSYTGYPVFDLEKLQKYSYAPLSRFILYIGNAATDMMKNFFRTTNSFYHKKGLNVLLGFLACDTVTRFLEGFVSFFVNVEWERKTGYFVYWTFTAIAVLIFATVYLGVLNERRRAIRVTRQKIRTGSLTFEMLSKGLDALYADKAIMDCMLPMYLPTRY